MANRYLIATGNWNGAVWAATSGGTAGSAATPTASDDVYLSPNLVVTLTADAECNSILLAAPPMSPYGYIKLNGNDLHVFGNATTECTIDGDGTLTVDGNYTAHSDTNKFPSLIVLNTSGNRTFTTSNRAFNDVRINMSGTNEALNITGSPIFRSLVIQSNNSAAHTVNFGSGATVTTNKFVAIGSSSSNKLIVKPSAGSSTIALSSGGSTYGQFVDMQVSASGSGVPKYIGANSTQSSGMGWLLQDPPKISTLVDPLTTAPTSNTNWSVVQDGSGITQVTNGHGGGGYNIRGPGLER